jgi:hypothetical protein
MSYLIEIVEGWTDALPFTLEADEVAIDLSGCTVTAVLKDNKGIVVDTTSDVTVTDSTAGQVEYAPDAVDFDADLSPYSLRFRVVDIGGNVVYFPSADAELIKVRT